MTTLSKAIWHIADSTPGTLRGAWTGRRRRPRIAELLCGGVLLATLGLTGCALRKDGPGAGRPEEPTDPAPLAAAEDESEGQPRRRTRVSQAALEVWNDPQFQRAFAQSYQAETEIEPRVTLAERETMQEVLSLISSEKLDEAAALLKQQRTEASSAVFDFTLANIYFQQEKLDEAAKYYRRAVDKFPKFRRAWQNLGLIYVRQGEFEKAVPALSRVIELGGNDGITYGLLGYAYASIGNSMSAESAYRSAILLDPETMDWKMGLARSFFRQQRYADAVAFLGQLIKAEPDRADLWMLQANAYIGMDKPMRAVENYEIIDRLGASTVESLNMLGDIYINEELFDLAVDAYARALNKDPEAEVDRAIRAAKVMGARGALEQTGELIQRLQDARGERLADAERKDLLKLEARIAVAEGAEEEEVRILEQIVELDPMDGEALLLLGQHHARSGDTEQAIFLYERAANIEGFEANAKVRHAQLLVKQGKYAEALPLLRRAQEIKPRENIQKYLDEVERVAKRG